MGDLYFHNSMMQLIVHCFPGEAAKGGFTLLTAVVLLRPLIHQSKKLLPESF
jgi:hypothetical protein